MDQLAATKEDVWLVYDGECHVCKTYCKYVRIREAVGNLYLVDARQPGELMNEITRLGLDIDQGMVLKIKDAIYYGPDAIHMLTLLSTPSGIFNRINYYVFSTKVGSKIFYPIGKAFRTVILKLFGIKYIGNVKNIHKTLTVDTKKQVICIKLPKANTRSSSLPDIKLQASSN